MSIEFIAHALTLQIPTGQKFVLVALANRANEDGVCWPSQNDIASQTSQSPRAVRGHIAWLCEHGYITKETRRRGNGSYQSDCFTIQRQILPTAESASGEICRRLEDEENTKIEENQTHPDQRQILPAVESAGLEPSIIKETSNIKRAKVSSAVPRPDDVPEELWIEFLAHRKAKRAPVSPTVVKQFRKEAENAGWSLEAAITECIARGWVGFKADWVIEKQRGTHGKSPHDNAFAGFANATARHAQTRPPRRQVDTGPVAEADHRRAKTQGAGEPHKAGTAS